MRARPRRVSPACIRVPLPAVGQRPLDFTCGPAVLHSILAYYGVAGDDQRKTAEWVKAHPAWGTHSEAIIRVARRHKLRTKRICPMTIEQLQIEVSRLRPVVCLIQAYNTGHFVAAVGFDRSNVYFQDPAKDGVLGYLPTPEFIDRWWDNETDGRVDRLGVVVYRASPPYTRAAVRIR